MTYLARPMQATCINSILHIRIYGDVSKPCTPVVHIKIAGKWMFIPLKMVLIGIDPYPTRDLMEYSQQYVEIGAGNQPCDGNIHMMEYISAAYMFVLING